LEDSNPMKSHRGTGIILVLILALTGWLSTLPAQEPASAGKEAWAAADAKIFSEIHDHNEVMSNLEYLSDIIGARLTGSENLEKANSWTRHKFADYGLENAHLESWTIAHSWAREFASGQIISPSGHPLTLASFGWAPSTSGVARGPITYVKAQTMEELEKYKGKLKGAIVITTEPIPLPPADAPAPNPLLVPYGDPFLLVRPLRPGERNPEYTPDYIRFLRARAEFLKSEGALAWLVDSGKPDGLLNMGSLGGHQYEIAPVPSAFITSENYSLIWRLLKRGPVEVELEITNSIGEKPEEVYNTVAEIRGSEKPDEVVVLGAHLDSWDLGTGTTDNGTGSIVVLEAARALEKLNLKPKRTIRFVLFSGEEQGLNGSRAYVAAHQGELPKISGALIHDTGTGRVISVSLMRNYQDREIMEKVLAPLRSLGLLELTERRVRGSDHASFDDAGIPGFFCIQEPAQYFQTHHSQADTFDQAHESDLIQGAQVVAAWAYNVAQLPDLLPRKPAAVAAEDAKE
jgi:carboxypeptidase Q